MQIQAINFLNHISPKRKTVSLKSLAFKGLISDVFQSSFNNLDKKVTVQNLKGEDVKAIISRTTPCTTTAAHPVKKYTIYIDNRDKGHLTLDGCDMDSLYMSHLSTERNSNRHYKGLGTELIKCAVNESKKKGKHGAITTCAHFYKEPPFLFYFKNNFKIIDSDCLDIDYPKLFNAPLQYAFKYNKHPFELIPEEIDTFYMKLDACGADALLEGKRLANSRICDTVDITMIDDELHSAQFIESPFENEYFLQVLNENEDSEKLCYIASLEPYEDENGKKHFKINEVLNWFETSSDMVDDFAQSLIPKLEEKYL